MPSEYLERWFTWEAAPFLPEVWSSAPDAITSLLFPPPTATRVIEHLRCLDHRIEQTAAHLRTAWRGPSLMALTVLRETQHTFVLPTQLRPTVVLGEGELCRPQDLCLDLKQ